MLKKSSLLYLSRFAIISSILYCIPVIFFLKDHTYSDTWLLYLGSAIFLACIFIFGIIYGKKNPQPSGNYNGFGVTILGVIFSCFIILILTLLLAPDVFNLGSSNSEVLTQTPAAIGKKNEHGLLFMMLANASIVNFCAGTFATVMTRSKNAEKNLPPNE